MVQELFPWLPARVALSVNFTDFTTAMSLRGLTPLAPVWSIFGIQLFRLDFELPCWPSPCVPCRLKMHLRTNSN